MNRPKNFTIRRMPSRQTNDPRKVLNAPGVVVFLVALTALAFFALLFLPERVVRFFEVYGAVSPYRFGLGASANGGVLAMFAPFVTHMFLHADLTHLGFNMLWLLAFGTPVAQRMGADNALQSNAGMLSAGIFTTFYFLCGAAGALVYILFHQNQFTFLVGASGGVSGLMGALVRIALARMSMFSPAEGSLAPLFSRGVLVWTAVVVGINVFIGAFGNPVGEGQIAWDAHIGGYLFGLITAPFFLALSQPQR